MMNRLFKRGMVIALAAAMTTSAGIPAMAAQKETQEETVTTSEVTQTNVDYGSLTQKEIEEFNSIYDRPDAIDKEVFLASVFGSILLGMGAAIVFHQGASTGGTSIIAAIISKFTPIGIGISVLLTDSFVCLLAISVFGVDKGLFGFFSVILIGLIIDKFIDGFNTCKQVFIITSKEKEIVNHIIKNIDRGCTVLNGNGGYTGSDVKIIYTVLNSNQFIALKKHVKEIDPAAFLTVNDSTEVLGEGFKAYE